MSDIGIAHWAAECDGGGERVAWELGRAFDEPVHLGSRSEEIESDDVACRDVFDSDWLDRIRDTPLQLVADLLAWERANRLREFETVITSGNTCLRYVPEDDQTWVAYLHHTRRPETDRFGTTVGGPLDQLVKMGQRLLHSSAASRPDVIVCNSEVVARRVRRYWGVRDKRLRIVHPPVAVDELGPEIAPTRDDYLVLGRLDDNKRVARLAREWSDRLPNRRLVVAGDGPEREAVEREAGDNVDVLGRVSERQKRKLLSWVRGVIMPADSEDFGIVPIEACASGTPVLGVSEGTTQHQISDGHNGYGWRWDAPATLVDAVERLESSGVAWSEDRIAEWAEQFGRKRFREEMRTVVAEAREEARVEPDLFDDVSAGNDPATAVATDGGETDEQ